MSSLCRVSGCNETAEHSFALAIAPNNSTVPPTSAEGSICLQHANELWASLGEKSKPATQIMAEELCSEINDGAHAVVIRMDKRMAGL